MADLRAAVADHKVGDKVQIVIERNGKKQTVTATLQEMPQDN